MIPGVCSSRLVWLTYLLAVPWLGFVSSKTAEEHKVYTLSDEKRLIKRLLKNYEDAGITGRPVQHTDERVLVNMSLSLIQILDLDEKNQVLTISVWVLFHWKDHILQWNPEDYSGIVEVRVPAKQVWTPDIVLYNYADERLKEMRDALVLVNHNGSITWMPPAIFKSNCKIDIKSFPFDEQTCHMKFGSWTYDGNRLDMLFIDDEKHVLLDDYTESNEWEITARPAMRNVKYYPCCQEPYPDLTFFLFLRRNAAFFSYILVLPCVLLSSLTLVIFWLPPESPAKMVLGMNIFVAFFLLLLLLADSTPQASNSVPYIGYYYCLNMVLITLSSFLSVIVINFYFRGDRRNRVPLWIRKICRVKTNDTEYLSKITNEDTTDRRWDHSAEDSHGYLIANNLMKAKSNGQNNRFEMSKDKLRDPPKSNLAQPRKSRKGRARFAELDKQEEYRMLNNDPRNALSCNVNSHHPQERPHPQTTQTTQKQHTPRSRSVPSSRDYDRWDGADNCPGMRLTYQDMHNCPQCEQAPPGTPKSRHQRHPQSCQVCMQHLMTLQPDRSRGSPYVMSTHDAQMTHSWYLESSMSNSNKAPMGAIYSTAPCNHLKYEYHDGKLIIVPSGCYQTMRKPEENLFFQKQQQAVTALSTEKLERDLREISQVVRSFLDRVSKKEADAIILREWRMVAMVLDRIFFLFYLVIHLCAAFGLLIPSSHETNVIEYLREYRLKNYNSTFTDEEAAQLSPVALMSASRYQELGIPSTKGPPGAKSLTAAPKTIRPNEALTKEKGKETLLSPYQKLSDPIGP